MFYIFYPTALATVYGQRLKFFRAEHSATAEGENCAYGPTLLFWQILISYCKFLMPRPWKWSILGAHITSDARYFIVDLVMSILGLFMVIFSPTTLISFTKLSFRWSFWVAQDVKIFIRSKAKYDIKHKRFHFCFLPFCKTKSWKFMSHKWPF